MLQEEPIDVNALLRRRFSVVPRGFDQDEVLDLVTALARHIDRIQRADGRAAPDAPHDALVVREREVAAAEARVAAMVAHVEQSLSGIIDHTAERLERSARRQ